MERGQIHSGGACKRQGRLKVASELEVIMEKKRMVAKDTFRVKRQMKTKIKTKAHEKSKMIPRVICSVKAAVTQ